VRKTIALAIAGALTLALALQLSLRVSSRTRSRRLHQKHPVKSTGFKTDIETSDPGEVGASPRAPT